MGDDRGNAYWEQGTLIIRASSFGGCIGALVRSAQGSTAAPPPAAMQKRFAEGNKAEPIIVAELARRGYALEGTGEPQLELELDVAGKVKIRCHPDGIINRSECAYGEAIAWGELRASEVLEIKALRPSFPHDFRPYMWQMSIEMACTGLAGLWVYGEKDEEGELVLEDTAGDHPQKTPKLKLVEQPEPPHSLLDIKRRALEIYRAVANGDIPECDFKQYPCGFYREEDTACHWSPEKKAEERAKIEELPVPESTITEFQVAKSVATQSAEDLKEITERLKGMVKDRPGGKYRAGPLTFSKIPGRVTLDRKALAKAHPEIDFSKFEKTGKDSWRLDVEN